MAEGIQPEENMLPNIQVQVIPKEEVSEEQLKEFIEFFRQGYGERWISEDHFRNVVMKNSTELLILKSDQELVAAFNLDHHRITDISVNPEYRGAGVGVRLFQEAAKHDPEVWITIGIDADGMLATVTSRDLNFLPVEDKEGIETLFRECNGTRENYQVGIEQINLPWLAERLAEKGVDHSNEFAASYRTKSLHGSDYKQLLFQNQIRI